MRRHLLQLIGRLYPAPVSIPNQPQRILLIRPDHLGDLLFLTPAVTWLRQVAPHSHLTLLVGSWGKAVLQNFPAVDEIQQCEFPGFTRRPKPALWQPYGYLRQEAQRLRHYAFDMAVIMRFDHWWGAWLAAAAGIPHRVGYAIPEVQPFLNHALPYVDQRHEVEQNGHLLAFALSHLHAELKLGDLYFSQDPAALSWAESWLQKHKVQPPILVMHPGAGAVVKQWRRAAWISLGRQWLAQVGGTVILTGSPGEVVLAREIATELGSSARLAAGQTNLSQLAALLARADLVIGPDTGPLKLAAAVGTKTLELYGPVDPVKFGPWGPSHRQRYLLTGLPCQPCNRLDYKGAELADHYCVRGFSVSYVLQAALDLLRADVTPAV